MLKNFLQISRNNHLPSCCRKTIPAMFSCEKKTGTIRKLVSIGQRNGFEINFKHFLNILSILCVRHIPNLGCSSMYCLQDRSPLFVGLCRFLWIVKNWKVRLFPFQKIRKDYEISYGRRRVEKKRNYIFLFRLKLTYQTWWKNWQNLTQVFIW